MKKFQLVIFDLDGTLLDTSKGIYNSVRYAEKGLGLKPVENNLLREFVGPPPKKMYKLMYNLSEDLAQKAVQLHREYGKLHAIFEAEIYEGIESVLHFLKENDYKIGVATLKSQHIAEKILQNFDLAKHFDVVVGMDEAETLTKAKTLMLAMDKVKVKNVEDVVLVGDSEYDLIGANEVGIAFIPALYGFGFKEKVEGSNIVGNINKPLELIAMFKNL